MIFDPAVDESNPADDIEQDAENLNESDVEVDEAPQENLHPSAKFIRPPLYRYFESVATQEVGTDHNDMNAVFAMDLDSVAILSDSVSNILKRLHTDPAKNTRPSVTISSHFQRRFTPKSSRFYVKTNTGPDGLKLQHKKMGCTTYQPVNLSRFRSIRLGEVLSSSMKFQLELYLVSERSFHGPTNFLTYDLLHPLCAAYNAVMMHPDRYMSSDLSPEQGQTFKTFLESKKVKFQIAPEKTKNVPVYEKNQPVFITFNQQDATIFFMAVEAALLDICEPSTKWKFTYTKRIFIPFQLETSYRNEALRKKAMEIVSSQLFCAQASGVQNIYPLKPSVILKLGEVQKIRDFSVEASKLIMEKIKVDMHEPCPHIGDGETGPLPDPDDNMEFNEDDTHATMFLFDIALTITPTQPNVSFLTSHSSGLPIAEELIEKAIPRTRRSTTTANGRKKSVLKEPDNSNRKTELYRNWFVEDRARVRHLGATPPPAVTVNVTPAETIPDYLQDVDRTRFTNPTVQIVQAAPSSQADQGIDLGEGVGEEMQIQETCMNGCPYNGSKDRAEQAYPVSQHPGNWKHIGYRRIAPNSRDPPSDSESEEENVSDDSDESGRDQLRMFRKTTYSLPLLIGNKDSAYVSKCQAQVMSIDEALRTAPGRNSHLTELEREKADHSARTYMHQKRIHLADVDTYRRLYSADAVADVTRGLSTIDGDEDDQEAVALPAEETEDDAGSLGSSNSILESLPGYDSNSSLALASVAAGTEETDLPTEIAIENQRRRITEYPQLGSHQVGNCHISNSTLVGTKKLLLEGEPNRWSHFVLKKEKLIDGVNMYTGFLRSYWQKKSIPQFHKSLPQMVSYVESILAGDIALDPELLLVSNSTKNETAESVYSKRAASVVEMMKGCSYLVDDIASSLENSDRHGVRLELTFTFNKIDDNSTLSWPLTREPANTLGWFRIAETTDLIEFFKMFKNRQVSVLKELFTKESGMMRAHLLSPPAKTAIVFLVECLVKVLDANGFRGPITEAFVTNLNLTIPDEAIVPVTEFDRELTGLEYGVHPMFLKCNRIAEFKVKRPPGFAIPSAQWLASPLNTFVSWPNRYLYHSNRINAVIKSFYSATQDLKNSGPDGGPPSKDQLVKYVHDHRNLCPKFISVNLLDLVQMPHKAQQALVGFIAEEVNNMYNAIWTGRIRTALQRRNHRQSFSSLVIPDKASQFQFLAGDQKEYLRLVDQSSEDAPRSMRGALARSSEVMMEAFCYPHKSGDQQWRKCPISKIFLYATSCLKCLQETAKKAPKAPPRMEGEEPVPPNLFLTNPPELLVEFFVNERTYTSPQQKSDGPRTQRKKEGSIIWVTTPEKLTKYMGLARRLAEEIPAILHQPNYSPSFWQGQVTESITSGQRQRKRARTTQASTSNSMPAQQLARSPPRTRSQPWVPTSTQERAIEGSNDTTVDSRIHQSIQNLSAGLRDKLGKTAITKLQKNEFFLYTDRFCHTHTGQTSAPVHEVVAIRALILSILKYLTEVEKTFALAVSSTNKWQTCFKTITLYNQYQNSYLYATAPAISLKIKMLKKNYFISQISNGEELKRGAPGIRGSRIKTRIWQSATKSLEGEDLQPFFETASVRPFISIPQLMVDSPPNHRDWNDWEEVLKEIANGHLYPDCLRKLIEGRTVYMERQEEALNLVREHPEKLVEATYYKTMWKSPDQPSANINDPSTYPPKYIPPNINL